MIYISMASCILIKYEQFLNWSIWPQDDTQIETTITSFSGTGSNFKKCYTTLPQISSTETSSSDAVESFT